VSRQSRLAPLCDIAVNVASEAHVAPENLMEIKRTLLGAKEPVSVVENADEPEVLESRTHVTRHHDVIRRWATRRQAGPATGEATASGPSTVDVQDGGAGIRFNFPGVARFRAIDWAEWFENFDANDLVFVYEELTTEGTLSYRYRLLREQDLWRS